MMEMNNFQGQTHKTADGVLRGEQELLEGSGTGMIMITIIWPAREQQSMYRYLFRDVRVLGVHGRLVLSCITDEALGVSERNVRGSCAVSLVITDNLHAIILPDTDAAVRRAKINADGGSLLAHRHAATTFKQELVCVVCSAIFRKMIKYS
jgi:hypothetical protein